MSKIIFDTERLSIRQIETTDFEMLFEICGNKELMKYVGDGIPLSEEVTKRWIEITLSNYENKGYGMYAVIYKSNNEFIGYCGLVYSKSIDEVELIYALKKEYWNKGLATEVSKQMLNFGLNSIYLKTIYASIDPENITSEKILKKIGFDFAFEKIDEFGLPVLYFSVNS